MLVQDVMRTAVATLAPGDTAGAALRIAQARGIRHVPIVDAGGLVGIVSDRDLKRALGARPGGDAAALEAVRVDAIMTRPVVTIGPMFPVEEAARMMVDERIGALPVVEGGRLIGIVTETDVLALFVRAMGAGEPSTRLDVPLGGRRDAVTEVVRAIEEAGVPVASIMTLVAPGGGREAVVRIRTMNPGPAVAALRARGLEVAEPWRAR